MTGMEALEQLAGLAHYLEDSIPEHIWDDWREYHEEQDEPIPYEDVNITACYNIIKAALTKGENNE